MRRRVDYSVVMGYKCLQEEYGMMRYMNSPRVEYTGKEKEEYEDILRRVVEYSLSQGMSRERLGIAL